MKPFGNTIVLVFRSFQLPNNSNTSLWKISFSLNNLHNNMIQSHKCVINNVMFQMIPTNSSPDWDGWCQERGDTLFTGSREDKVRITLVENWLTDEPKCWSLGLFLGHSEICQAVSLWAVGWLLVSLSVGFLFLWPIYLPVHWSIYKYVSLGLGPLLSPSVDLFVCLSE